MAKSSSSDRRCCNCGTNCDEKSQILPVNVTPADDPNGRPELWCPPCFTFRRMHAEPERFNASSALAVRCQFCGVTAVCFSVSAAGAASCPACTAPGAMPVRPDAETMAAMLAAVRDAAEDAKILKDVRK